VLSSLAGFHYSRGVNVLVLSGGLLVLLWFCCGVCPLFSLYLCLVLLVLALIFNKVLPFQKKKEVIGLLRDVFIKEY
jgi:hypothetical protein